RGRSPRRVRRDRPGQGARPRDADRLGALAARDRRRPRRRRDRARRSAIRPAGRAARAGAGGGARARGGGGTARTVRRTALVPAAAWLPVAGAAAAPGGSAPQGAPAVVLGARAVRALLVPLLRRARGGAPRAAGHGSGSNRAQGDG